jgi:hypothetical protein
MNWPRGAAITERCVHFGRVIQAVPEVVDADDGDTMTLFLRCGTPIVGPTVKFDTGDIEGPEPRIWRVTNVLKIFEPARWSAVWLMWDTDWTHLCWYVCLQEPFWRTPIGVDTRDLQLDIVITPDLSEWRWKDRDHFARAQELGWISRDEARHAEDEAQRRLDEMAERAGVFGRDWTIWRPDPAWTLPDLSPDWRLMDPRHGER